MTWMRELSLLGKDPDLVKDAETPFLFEIPDNPRFFKGCVIGDPCNCSASKAIMNEKDVVWAWVGAHIAIVEFSSGDILRYQHTGVIPKTQDKLIMPVPGIYRLSVIRPSQRLGGKSRTGNRTGKKPATGRRINLSTAGLLRR